MIKNKVALKNNTKRCLLICLIFVFVFAMHLFAQSSSLRKNELDDSIIADLKQFIPEYLKQQRIRGAAITLVFVGNFIGLIIYLIVRNDELPRQFAANKPTELCHNCGKSVILQYAFCPYCGTRMKAACPSCEKSLNSDWKVCPYCGERLRDEK